MGARFPEKRLEQIGNGGPVLEIWERSKAGALLFYPGTMLAPGHYDILLNSFWKVGFNVIGLHLSGHGQLIKNSDFTFNSLLEQGIIAEQWLYKHGFKQVIAVGHSQGGILTLAHACSSPSLAAAFAISAVFPKMAEAINLTRFAQLSEQRERIMRCLRALAGRFPGIPLPLPFYLQIKRILAGKKLPVHMGKAKGRLTYPIKFLVSLFDAEISGKANCPFYLLNSRNDALFTQDLIEQVFAKIIASQKDLLWLPAGGHMAPLNPWLAEFIARKIGEVCSGLHIPLHTG